MKLYNTVALLVAVTAVFGYVSHRYLKLPGAIGLTVLSLISSLLAIGLGKLGVDWLLTWGGLRGGISVALALSLPDSMPRDLLVGITYMVVIFSIIGQGLSIGPLIKKLGLSTAEEAAGPVH